MRYTSITRTFVVMLGLFCLLAITAFGQNGGRVWLEEVEGLIDGKIPAPGGPVTFHLSYENYDPVNKVKGMTNGYVLCATGDVTWTPSYGWDPSFPTEWFDLITSIGLYGWDGAGCDSIRFSGSIIVGPGLPPGFIGPVCYIGVDIDDNSAFIGETFCLDSAYLPPSSPWMWSCGAPGSFAPAWDGPHCFEIVSCCQGIRGNVDGDQADQVDIADLIYLVDWMFSDYAGNDDDHGPPPACLDEADIDGSGSNDISDLVYLVDFMFLGGLPPAPCQ